ncbi:MAG: NUDIX hydrolase [Thermodesulfobacteriota bacterium]
MPDYPHISREYPLVPLVGVGALILQGDSVLLVRRGKPPAFGQWSIPGGLVRVGEGLREATAREALEETGLEVTVGPLVELLERIFPDSKGRVQYHYVIADFLCTAHHGTPIAGSDALETGWRHRAELDSLGLPDVTRKVILKAFTMNGREGL